MKTSTVNSKTKRSATAAGGALQLHGDLEGAEGVLQKTLACTNRINRLPRRNGVPS